MRPLLLAAVAGSLLASVSAAQTPDTAKVAVERTPEVAAAESVALAAALAAYGRRERDAQALVAAASLLLDNPAPTAVFEGEGEGEDEGLPPLEPGALLDEAVPLAADGGALRARIAELRGRVPDAPPPPVRGAEEGPKRAQRAVDAGDQRRHRILFRGRETATIHLVGDGSSDLDYYLYDVNGELVASSDGPTDSAALFWYVPYRQLLELRVRNRGDSRNAYHVVTN